jgi:hypothetical protein
LKPLACGLRPGSGIQGALKKKTPTEVFVVVEIFGDFFDKYLLVFGVFELPMQRNVKKTQQKFTEKATWNVSHFFVKNFQHGLLFLNSTC